MQQEKANVNGPKGPNTSKETMTKADVGTVNAAALGGAAPAATGLTPAGKKKLAKDEIRALIRDYDKVEAEMNGLHAKLIELKRQRSKVVQTIYEGSPDTKSFRFQRSPGAEPEVLVIMSREDKNEKSPSFGERFYYFRRPGIPEPFDL